MSQRNDCESVYDNVVSHLKDIPWWFKGMYAVNCVAIWMIVFVIVFIVKYATITVGCILKLPKNKKEFDGVVESCIAEMENAFNRIL